MYLISTEIGSIKKAVGLAFVVCLCVLAMSCDIALNDEAKFKRAEAAYARAEYRSAMIDMRSLLQRAPEHREARLLLGRSAFSINDMETAAKELSRYVTLGGDIDDVAAELGKALLVLRRYQEVLDTFLSGEQFRSDNAQAALFVAQAYTGLGQTNKARGVYEKLSEDDQLGKFAQLGIAQTFMEDSKSEKALSTVQDLLSANADFGEGWLVLGQLQLELRRYARSIESFQKVLSTTDLSVALEYRALIGMTDSLFAIGDLEQVKTAALRLRELRKDNLAQRLIFARYYLLTGSALKAESELEFVLSLVPKLPQALLLMGIVQIELDNLRKAEMYLKSAMSETEGSDEARNALATVYLKQDKPAFASSLFNESLRLGKLRDESLQLAVLAASAAGDSDLAIDYLKRRLISDANYVDQFLDVAEALLASDQVDDAERVLKAVPSDALVDDSRAASLLVLVHIQKGNLKLARQGAEELVKNWPDDLRARKIHARTMILHGSYDDAEASLDAIRRMSPDDASIDIAKGFIELGQGNVSDSKFYFEKAAIKFERSGRAVPLLLLLAELSERTDDSERSVRWLERAHEIDAGSDTVRLMLSRAYVSINDLEQALQTLAVDLDSVDVEKPDFVELLAEIMLRKDAGEEVLDILTELSAKYPNRASTVSLISEVHNAYGRTRLAYEFCRHSLTLDPSDQTKVVRCYSYALEVEDSNPRKLLVDYLAKNSGDTAIRLILAQDYQRLGNVDAAIRQYEQVLDSDSKNLIALNNVAWLLKETSLIRATNYAARAYELAPDSPSVADTYGWLLVLGGQKDNGVKILRSAYDRNALNLEIGYHLALGLFQLGEREESASILQNLVNNDPSAASRENIRELQGRLAR